MPRRKKADIEDVQEMEKAMSSLNKTKVKLKKLEFSAVLMHVAVLMDACLSISIRLVKAAKITQAAKA